MMAKTFAIGGEAFKAYKDAAAKEASSGGWMADKFEQLVFTPTVNLLAQEIKSLESRVKANNEEKTSYLYATLSMAAILPTLILLLVVMLVSNSWIVREMKTGLNVANETITDIQGAMIKNQAQGPVRAGGAAAAKIIQPPPINM